MATIYSRLLKDGSCTWRVQFRRKDLPYFNKSFSSYEDAIAFVERHEENFIKNPDEYFKRSFLDEKREREFKRKHTKAR